MTRRRWRLLKLKAFLDRIFVDHEPWLSKSSNPKAPFAKGSLKIEGKEYRIVVWQRQKAAGEDKKPDFVIELDQPRGANPA